MAIQIALMGAGGKMGCRLTDNLIKHTQQYKFHFVEISKDGIANLAQRGLQATPQSEALQHANVVILALPDRLIGEITHEIVPMLQPGSMIISLDPAAAYAGVMLMRDDLTYFIAHPCHPPVFNDETTAEARSDWFGGVHAKQSIVCALQQGPETDYLRGEAIAKVIYAPVMNAYRVTVEQMVILEPALVETTLATLLTGLRQALDLAVQMGVPEDAARAFLFGHIRTELAIIFELSGFPFSDGALLAIDQAYDKVFRPDWKQQIMDIDAITNSVGEITNSL